MKEKINEYIQLLEETLLSVHQKQEYQQILINEPTFPEEKKEIIVNRIEELSVEINENELVEKMDDLKPEINSKG